MMTVLPDSVTEWDKRRALQWYKRGHSDFLVGRGHEVEATAMEVDGCEEIAGAAESASSVLDPLDLRIN